MLIGPKGLILLLSAAVVDKTAFAFTPSRTRHIRSIVKSSSYGHHLAGAANAVIQNNHRTGNVVIQKSTSRLHSSQSTDDLQSNDDDLDKLTVPALKEHLKQLGLPVGGRKSDLIERLEGAVANANNEDDGEIEIGEGIIDMDSGDPMISNISPPSPAPSSASFESLGLSADLISATQRMKWTEPTPVQQLSIPAILDMNEGTASSNSLWCEGPTGRYVRLVCYFCVSSIYFVFELHFC